MFPTFFTTRRGVLEKSFFLINFIGVIFEEGNETREKIWSDLVAEQKWRAERKVSGFLFIQLFLREREIDVWKNFLWASEIFFVHVRLLKAVFLQFFLFMRFDNDIVLDLGSFWLELKVSSS